MPTNYTYEGVNNTIQRLVVVSPTWLTTGRIQIPIYTTILLLAVTGNALVNYIALSNGTLKMKTYLNFTGYIDPSPKQTNAYDNKCLLVEFGCIGYIAGSFMYAIYVDRNTAEGFCVR